MQKRGQFSTLGYILVAVLVVSIMLIGARAILTVKTNAEKIALSSFWNGLDTDAETMVFKLGATNKFIYEIPQGFDKVCFADSKAASNAIGSVEIQKYPLVIDAINNTNKNVFLLGSSEFESYRLPRLVLSNAAAFICFDVLGSTAEISMKGTPSGPMVIKNLRTVQKIEYYNDNIIASADGQVKLYVPALTYSSVDEIFVEIVPQEKGYTFLSEVYRFGPSGATFNPPIMMAMKYAPALVGESCPDNVFFYQFDDEGNLAGGAPLEADSINCLDKTVVFTISQFG